MTGPVVSDQVFVMVLGKELRRAREARGWTRAQLVDRLPSGICGRTLHSYEHGDRSPSISRLYEVCRALGVSGSEMLRRAEDAAANVSWRTLTVDLRAVGDCDGDGFSGVAEWARRRLLAGAGATVRLAPSTVREMAAALGLEHAVLAAHLAEFVVDDEGGIDHG